jgi:hypothetical protein
MTKTQLKKIIAGVAYQEYDYLETIKKEYPNDTNTITYSHGTIFGIFQVAQALGFKKNEILAEFGSITDSLAAR